MKTLEQVFAEIQPYRQPPKRKEREAVEQFILDLGFEQGKLYHSVDAINWAFGNMEDPKWLGKRGLKKNECIIGTEPFTPFMFMGIQLLYWVDTVKGRKCWLYWIKCLVDDRFVYFPLSPGMRKPGIVEQMKELFHESTAQTLV